MSISPQVNNAEAFDSIQKDHDLEASQLRVTYLNNEVTRLQKEVYRLNNHYASLEKAGKYYMVMQRMINETPHLQQEWLEFVKWLYLLNPEFEETVKNFKFEDFDLKK